jgi:hypothetical protein
MPEELVYIGTKIVKAYQSEKDGINGYHITYEDGYESWSPLDVFERCYRPLVDSEKKLIGGE